jgi:hypothetical protein
MARLNVDDEQLHSINLCVFSHPGEGKSAFWGSGNNRVFIMDSDPGLGTQTCKALGQTPLVMPVVDYDDLHSAYEYVKEDLRRENPECVWVIWDSLTLFQDRVLIDEIMPDAVAENPRQEEFVPSRREYLINMNKIGRYVRLFVDMPYINFGCSAHVEITQDNDGKTLYMPQVQGKNMPSKITGYMNVVGYMDKATVDGKNVQRILWQREGKFFAKDRFGALGHHMDRPTLPKVIDAIEAKHGPMPQGKVAPPAAPRPPVRRPAVKAVPIKKAAASRPAATK